MPKDQHVRRERVPHAGRQHHYSEMRAWPSPEQSEWKSAWGKVNNPRESLGQSEWKYRCQLHGGQQGKGCYKVNAMITPPINKILQLEKITSLLVQILNELSTIHWFEIDITDADSN